MRRFLFLSVLFLTGCIIAPHTTQVYDHKCDNFRKKITLQPKYIVTGCHGNDQCKGLIGGSIFTGIITGTASAIFMAVGNTYYALDHKKQCKTKLDKQKVKIIPKSIPETNTPPQNSVSTSNGNDLIK
jgi:hypothetical protein